MPEGDTVYRVARQLHAALAGGEVVRSDFRVPAAATVDLSGETVREVVSRGKHILMRVGAYTVHSHLRMEGRWRVYDVPVTPDASTARVGAGRLRRRAGHGGPLDLRRQTPLAAKAHWAFAPGSSAHDIRAIIATPDRVAVGFELGMLDVLPTAREDQVVGHLGPDLLGPDWDAAEAARRLAADPAVPVFLALQDQRNLAGIGNEFANELCFVRGLDPALPAGEVDDVPALVGLARRMLLANRDRPTRVTTGVDRPGRRSWVFAREGRPCARCGTRILKSGLGADPTRMRDAYRCPACQPRPLLDSGGGGA